MPKISPTPNLKTLKCTVQTCMIIPHRKQCADICACLPLPSHTQQTYSCLLDTLHRGTIWPAAWEANVPASADFALQRNMFLHHFSAQTCGRPADEAGANRKNTAQTYHVKATREHNRFGSQHFFLFFTAARCSPEGFTAVMSMKNGNTNTFSTLKWFIKKGLIPMFKQAREMIDCNLRYYRETKDHREFKDPQDLR